MQSISPQHAVGKRPLICLPHGHGLQLTDCSLNPKPDALPVMVAAFEHFVGSPRCHYFSVGFIFADQQIGSSPYIAIGDHSASSRWQITRPISYPTRLILCGD
jgi:hypothetical protein